jgi:hypothetical protein
LPALKLTLKLALEPLRKKPVEEKGEVSSGCQADRSSNILLTCQLAFRRELHFVTYILAPIYVVGIASL